MTIPFLSLFKRAKAKDETAIPAPVKAAPLEKPSSERFSKTVMPNASRTVAPRDPFQGGMPMSAAPAAATVHAPQPAAAVQRTVGFGGGSAPASPGPSSNGLPPAVALALEPKVERVIALELDDIIAQLPAGSIKPDAEIDGTRRILLKASEVEKGMASGKPSVSLASIYQQVPELFAGTVAAKDAAQVALPFRKVLDQFANLHVRADQERAQAVPHVETPFLRVTLEDDERFGTKTEVLQSEDLPPVRLQPATAEAIAAAEPEPAAREVSPAPSAPPLAKLRAAPLRISLPPEPAANGSGPAPAEPKAAEPAPKQPARIPFKLAPNGTGAPASESVPASGGPSVPTSLPAPLAPARIPFKVTAPCEDLRPKPEAWLTAESLGIPPKNDRQTAGPTHGATKITLPLKPILTALPPFQVNGDLSSVVDDARIELPFSVVEPQLAAGRISVTPQLFHDSLPEAYRELFIVEDSAPNVALPLQDVLKNLPAASLRMRDDQEEQETGSNFATPFSAKAEEDAKRFQGPAGPVAKPTVVVPEAEKPVAEKAAAELMRTPLQIALDTNDELDAKGVVARVTTLSGIDSCAIVFRDGLNLAGSLPTEAKADGLCAMAPSLVERIENHTAETNLGAIEALTVACAKGSLTFFSHENLCLTALHNGAGLTNDVRQRLNVVVRELSKKYSHPA